MSAVTPIRKEPMTQTPDGRPTAIRRLLEQLPELTDPGTGTAGTPGSGDRVITMPHDPHCAYLKTSPPRCTCWRRSVVELERLLYELQFHNFAWFRQLTLRYLRAQHITRELTYSHGTWQGLAENEAVIAIPGGWTLTLADARQKHRNAPLRARVKVARWDTDVKPATLNQAVQWLADQWSLNSEPMQPNEKAVA